ncbi:conjugal transfer protein MobC [Chitinophaga barathri]|uniref:Conjugal transfer protein TraG n=1 Tax=Chitinophaga barathri TaxID=1647451 RepID=A0A3N4MHN7_9BACT|nr:conjugal transfer protein MobC [Chitinophaga barathri]RPD43118.1 conjugal transfer protein TraG [Chitinophaga barathri]
MGPDIDPALRAITDFVRKASVVLLVLHYYIFCYAAFQGWGLAHPMVARFLSHFAQAAFIGDVHFSKLFIWVVLAVSMIGTRGKKDEKIRLQVVITMVIAGTAIYFASILFFYVSLPPAVLTVYYIAFSGVGFLMMLAGGSQLSRYIKLRMRKDIFNLENETFPQMEQAIRDRFVINLPGKYRFGGKVRDMFINIYGLRGTLICGSPGAGKTAYIVKSLLYQSTANAQTLFVYDFKYDDLTRVAYNAFLKNRHCYERIPRFCVINFDRLNESHRCNPLDPTMMDDITDAAEASRSILFGLNKSFVAKAGDFFVESAINFVTAVIWFLRQYQDGRYCTLPHVLELLQADYEMLFPVLGSVEAGELDAYLSPYINAYTNRAMEQLEGQIASAKIGLARLSSPQLYYVMSGNDFSLDINNPEDPKILCIGNNPVKLQTYGAVISLYTSRMLKLVNRQKMEPCTVVFEEYPTIFQPLDTTIATCRQNKVSIFVIVQSIEQLRKDYTKEQADVVINICGNIIAGQGTGDTARTVSERIGKIVQERESVSINRTDTSMSRNTNLEFAVPASRISNLSAGEFAGVVTDMPSQPVPLKAFHCQIQNDWEAIKREEDAYEPLPQIRNVTQQDVMDNYIRIKNEVAMIVQETMERIKSDPELAYLLFTKK